MAPFASEKQRKYMYKFHPKIAERWGNEEKRKGMVKAVKKHIGKK